MGTGMNTYGSVRDITTRLPGPYLPSLDIRARNSPGDVWEAKGQ